MTVKDAIAIDLRAVANGLVLHIDARTQGTLFESADAQENNEAPYQLVEGCYYDFTFSDPSFTLREWSGKIVIPHSRHRHTGTLAPNIYVGTLNLLVHRLESSGSSSSQFSEEPIGKLALEVQSVKTGYRDDYRDMLELITEKCTSLLFQSNSPSTHHFEVDYAKDSRAVYQRFSFVKSIINSEEFAEAIHRIVTDPVTHWAEVDEMKDIRQARHLTNKTVKELLKGGRRTILPQGHKLQKYGINSLPERITTQRKADTVDTPENRFIKNALEVFLKFCMDVNKLAPINSQLFQESDLLIKKLESHLHHTIFNEISRPQSLQIGSPVLQRKEGYREVLRVWLMFDLAAKLIWTGGDDVYQGGKKDIATLYEYWLFFKLLEVFQELYEIAPKDLESLIEETDDGLNLKLKQGRYTALEGIYDSSSRKLRVRFSYNRSFSGNKSHSDAGSWTTTLRPDYTLSFWPYEITEARAEEEELIVHIHFDAKYKVTPLVSELIHKDTDPPGVMYALEKPDTEPSGPDLDREKTENRKGIYKNADLLKMHAYKDAIRRTGGAYVLYPGDTTINKTGFHEIIPGLGAFPVRPSKIETGIEDLKKFLVEVTEHFMNRTSQREKFAFRRFDIHRNLPEEGVRDSLPEALGERRDELPDATFVMVGYYNKENYNWIRTHKRYCFRMAMGNESLVLDTQIVGAKYLLLFTAGETTSGDIWRIVSDGPRIIPGTELVKTGFKNSSQEHYLAVDIAPVQVSEFRQGKWRINHLQRYGFSLRTGLPFVVSLADLWKGKLKD